MAKTIFEEIGGVYERQGDYFVPHLTLPDEEDKAIGIWGKQHLRYIKEYKRMTYTTLLTNGKLNSHLADIDRQAGRGNVFSVNKADGRKRRRNRNAQSGQSNALGTMYE